MSSPLVHPKLNKIDSSMKTIMRYMKKYQYLGEGEIDFNGAISFRYKTIKNGEYELWLRIGLSEVIRKYNNDSANFLKTAKSLNNKERIAEIEQFLANKKEKLEEIVKTNSPFYELKKVLDKIKSESYNGIKSTVLNLLVDNEYYFTFAWGTCYLERNEKRIIEYKFPSNNNKDDFGSFILNKKFKNTEGIILNKDFYDDVASKLIANNVFGIIEYHNKLSALMAKYQTELLKIKKSVFSVTDRITISLVNPSIIHHTNQVEVAIGENRICYYYYNKILKENDLEFSNNDKIYNYEYVKSIYEKLEEYYPKFIEEIKGMYSID